MDHPIQPGRQVMAIVSYFEKVGEKLEDGA